MSLTYNNLSDDWGWYIDIDIEIVKPIKYIKTNLEVNSYKKFNQYSNRLDTIQEDEYDYYMNNQKNLDDTMVTYINKKTEDKSYLSKNLFNIGSTTMITALLTYIIFFMF